MGNVNVVSGSGVTVCCKLLLKPRFAELEPPLFLSLHANLLFLRPGNQRATLFRLKVPSTLIRHFGENISSPPEDGRAMLECWQHTITRLPPEAPPRPVFAGASLIDYATETLERRAVATSAGVLF